jgi:hypothetical protein
MDRFQPQFCHRALGGAGGHLEYSKDFNGEGDSAWHLNGSLPERFDLVSDSSGLIGPVFGSLVSDRFGI